MMKPGYRQNPRQRGALEPPSPDSTPPLSDLAHQADHLEARIRQLKVGIHNLIQLHQTQATSSANQEDLPLAQAELAQLQKAVDDFEIDLASRILTWQHLQEPFWQAVRYGGLGLVVGWFLHWLLQQG